MQAFRNSPNPGARTIAYLTNQPPSELSKGPNTHFAPINTTDRTDEIEESSPMPLLSAFTVAPTIETSRLILRAHRPGDLESVTAMWAEPAVLRYVRKSPYPREEVWTRMLRYAGHWLWMGFGFWIVTDKTDGRFLGEVGIHNFERDMEPEFSGTPELGYSLIGAAHGKGYATEAAKAVLNWFDGHIDLPHTNCMTSPDNIHSQRVALKCGYEYLRQSIHLGSPVAIFRRRRVIAPTP
ncbi:GNAT family N-acetyltransferase [Labrys portucalensis]|uniref:GNAT family N-acetyltransferase n=2 Tax=Labrys neptuniae TaxID=376174 RepID=A0ABV6Z845_9HYPH